MIIIPFIIIGAVLVIIFIIIVRVVVAPKRGQHLAQLYNQKKIPLAIKQAKQILAKDPHNHLAHYYLGLCYLSDKKPELALMELKVVDQLGIFDGEINELNFRTTIAELFSRFNQHEEAQKEYLLLIQMQPQNAKFYYEAGRLFELRNHPDKAVKYYRKATELDNRNADAFGRLGSILYRAKRLSEAKEYLEQSVRLQAENVHACFALGKICKEGKDFQGALKYFEKSCKDPELKAKSLLERATCFISTGDMVQAVSELERSLKASTDENNTETLYARYLLAYCHEHNRNYDDAITQWELINAKKPNFRDVPAKLAQYQDIKSDDTIKDYLTSGDDEFIKMCTKVINSMGHEIQEVKKTEKGFEFLANENQNKWRNTKRQPVLYAFIRETETIEEPIVRLVHEKVKNGNMRKAIVITSSSYSRGAREFAESRPIDLVDKDRLLAIIKQ